MKRSKLIKLLASVGIIVLDTSCEKGIYDANSEKENHPLTKDLSLMKTKTFIPFTPIAHIKLDKGITRKIIALTRLSDDIFNNPKIAKSFSDNPSKYLKSIGIEDISLDLNSIEVKSVLALGDKDIQEAIRTNNINKYIELLETKNYLNFESIKVDKQMLTYIENQFNNDKNLSKIISPQLNSNDAKSAAVAAVAVVYVVAAVVSQAGVVYNVGAAINAVAAINIAAWVNVSTQTSSSSNSSSSSNTSSSTSTSMNTCGKCHVSAYSLYDRTNHLKSDSECTYNYFTSNPVLKIWGYEKNQNDTYVIHPIIEKNVEEIVEMIENLDVYKNSKNKLKTEQLKRILRKPITQKMIDLGLI